MTRKMKGSWEKPKGDNLYSPAGIDDLKTAVKDGLYRLYTGIAESMWRYEYSDPRFDLMRRMSRDTVPEKFNFNNGTCCWFVDPVTDTIHCLPYVTDAKGINMYGYPISWSPIPVGWDETKEMPTEMVRIHDLKLNDENSVIMRNDLFGASDIAYTSKMVDELVENVLTINQLQLLSKIPFVFNVDEDNLLTAKNVFLAICENRPVIFMNALGDRALPVVENTGVKIDPSLFEIFDRFECMLLSYYGFPCVPITKRAQQTVSEVQSNDSKLYARRQEKYNQRKVACERISEVLGASITVISVVDELAQQALEDAQGSADGKDDPRTVAKEGPGGGDE